MIVQSKKKTSVKTEAFRMEKSLLTAGDEKPLVVDHHYPIKKDIFYKTYDVLKEGDQEE
ncbi:hypothetical protein ES702_00562 [subsurface metagenome]